MSPTSGMQCVHCARVASTAAMAGMAESEDMTMLHFSYFAFTFPAAFASGLNNVA